MSSISYGDITGTVYSSIDIFRLSLLGCRRVEVRFADQDLDRLETDPGFTAGYGPDVVRQFRKRMQQIRAAVDERDFYRAKGLHFEKLQGSKKDERSMRLNDQWRLIVTLEGEAPKAVVVVEIRDYH